MWSMSRLEVTNEYPYPDIRGGKNGGGLRFYPEGIGQDLASRKYKILFGRCRKDITGIDKYGKD